MAASAGGLVSTLAGNTRNTFVSGWGKCSSELEHELWGQALCVEIAFDHSSLDDGRSSSAGMFVGGFVLGGIIVGALGCVYAPQIIKALARANTRELMSRLPKFIYDEEKASERTCKVQSEKIEQLNSAIDEVSAQLRVEDPPNGSAVNTDEIEATM